MDTTISLILSSLLSGVGLIAGGSIFEEYSQKETISHRLKKTGHYYLDTVGNKNENEWLVLAQQYRENGATITRESRDFSTQSNPGFLSDYVWETYAKHSGEDKKISDFSKDSDLARELKSACNAALDSLYSPDLFSKVIRWCDIQLSNTVKNLLRLQKESGNCRFRLIDPSNNKRSWFVWENFEKDTLFTWHLYRSFVSNPSSWGIITGQKDQFVKECKSKPNQIVDLVYKETNMNLYNKKIKTWALQTQ